MPDGISALSPTISPLSGADASGVARPSVGIGSLSAESAQFFATLLRAQMDSMIASTVMGDGFGGSGGGSSSGLGGLGSLGGGLGGSLGSSGLLGGSGLGGGLGDSMSSMLLMQTMAPLADAINRLVDALGGSVTSLGGAGDATPLPTSLPHGDLLQRMADTYQVPAAFLGAVMMAESAGNTDAVGDDGEAVGLFQLHARGLGAGLGDLRYDAELNAAIGARSLAAGWHEGTRQGLSGEERVRFAYDYQFNPGGGFQWQGDHVYANYRFYQSIAERGGLDA